jgi:hypothetical protein
MKGKNTEKPKDRKTDWQTDIWKDIDKDSQ